MRAASPTPLMLKEPVLPQVDLVQVQLEDVLLVRAPFEHEGEQRLLQLALHRTLGGQEEILAELLGDGAAALHVALGPEVPHRGPRDAEGIEPGVGEEAAILDGEHGLDEVLGQLLVLDEPALLARLVEEVGDELGLEGLLRILLLRLPTPHVLHAVLVEGARSRARRRRPGAGGA